MANQKSQQPVEFSVGAAAFELDVGPAPASPRSMRLPSTCHASPSAVTLVHTKEPSGSMNSRSSCAKPCQAASNVVVNASSAFRPPRRDT